MAFRGLEPISKICINDETSEQINTLVIWDIMYYLMKEKKKI
jgi:hypothetical protein